MQITTTRVLIPDDQILEDNFTPDFLDNFPSVKVLMMYGTFDSIEEDELKAAGVAAHIVKPFDSTKFVNICRSLSLKTEIFRENKTSKKMSQDKTGDIDLSQLNSPSEDLINDWKVDAPNVEVSSVAEQVELPRKESNSNPLLQEAQDWGMEIPAIIDSANEDLIGEIPPIMSSVPAKSNELPSALPDKIMPKDDDLEYPDVMSIMNEIDIAPLDPAPKSKLVPMNDFTPPSTESEIDFSGDDNERVKSLEAQISDEEEDLWSVDEHLVTSNTGELPGPIEDKRPLDLKDLNEQDDFSVESMLPPKKSVEVLKDIDALFPEEKTPVLKTQAHDFFEQDVSHKIQHNHVQDFDFEQFKQDIFNRLKPELTALVKDLIKQEVQSQLDRNFSNEVKSVAWEVIPSLAENLIREEIESIKRNVN
jgi:response regulator RpfG family c-di-GMP phosphodiesterase